MFGKVRFMGNLISVNIKKLRIAKKFTQEQLAEMLNVNTQTISRWEYELLTTAYLLSGKFEEAYDWFKKSIKKILI